MRSTDQNLSRFIQAQEPVYTQVLQELKSGKKTTHWMWFIFPQVAGLGFSETSVYYSIKNIAEAEAYLVHPILGNRLTECTTTVYDHNGKSAESIFGYPDYLKLQSSMTLFSQAKGGSNIFSGVLQKYFSGKPDNKTMAILNRLGST